MNDTFKEMLRNKGYKLTVQRQSVLDFLKRHEGEHLSPEEIYELIKKENPDIGIATIYRTLSLLEDMKLVYKLNFDDGCSRYELSRDSGDHRHHHLICTSCGSVTEVEDDLLEYLENVIHKKNGFIVEDHRVKFYGLCKKCQKETVT